MAAVINLIAQHSQGYLVVKPDDAADEEFAPPGLPIIHEISAGGAISLGYAQFRVEPIDGVWCRIVAASPYFSNMVLDVQQASHEDGAPVILWPWHGGSNQLFRAIDAPALTTKAWGCSLQAQHSGKVLDVLGGSVSPGVQVVQWNYHGGANQLFRVFGSPIKPAHADLVLDVVQALQGNGAPVIQFSLHGKPNQLFRVELVFNAPDGQPGETGTLYRIVAEHSGKVFDIEGASLANGAPVIQWDWHGGPNQLFDLEKNSDGSGFRLYAAHSRKALDISGASQELGARLIQWHPTGGLNQCFRL
jgi:hypothetical protein